MNIIVAASLEISVSASLDFGSSPIRVQKKSTGIIHNITYKPECDMGQLMRFAT